MHQNSINIFITALVKPYRWSADTFTGSVKAFREIVKTFTKSVKHSAKADSYFHHISERPIEGALPFSLNIVRETSVRRGQLHESKDKQI
jgi:hypothetical protein